MGLFGGFIPSISADIGDGCIISFTHDVHYFNDTLLSRNTDFNNQATDSPVSFVDVTGNCSPTHKRVYQNWETTKLETRCSLRVGMQLPMFFRNPDTLL